MFIKVPLLVLGTHQIEEQEEMEILILLTPFPKTEILVHAWCLRNP